METFRAYNTRRLHDKLHCYAAQGVPLGVNEKSNVRWAGFLDVVLQCFNENKHSLRIMTDLDQ